MPVDPGPGVGGGSGLTPPPCPDTTQSAVSSISLRAQRMPWLSLYMVTVGAFLGVQRSDAELFKPQIHFSSTRSPDSSQASTPPPAPLGPDTGVSPSGGRKTFLYFSFLFPLDPFRLNSTGADDTFGTGLTDPGSALTLDPVSLW